MFAAFDDLCISEMLFRVSGPEGIFSSPVSLENMASIFRLNSKIRNWLRSYNTVYETGYYSRLTVNSVLDYFCCGCYYLLKMVKYNTCSLNLFVTIKVREMEF